MWPVLFIFTIVGAGASNLKSPLEHSAREDGQLVGETIGNGRVKRYINFNENQATPQFNGCVRPDGSPGLCKAVHDCVIEDYMKDIFKFVKYMCLYQETGVGTCCPDNRSINGEQGLAGNLPATARKEEDPEILQKISRAENRGCGLSTRAHGRLVGAQPANSRDWPWIASVTPEGFEQYCGGVLITDQHVLTAAHCIRRWSAEELTVRLGEYDLQRTNDSRTYNFRVVEKRQHEGFDPINYHHDIAILKLHRPAVFNTYVWPICLPPIGMDLTNESAIIIGWGTTSYGGPHSNVLMEVSVPVWEHKDCVLSFTDSIFDESLCAGNRNGGKDSCQGDSGGPLMYQMPSGRWSTIGVVSWGIRCGEPSHPGIYTKVDKYLRWIVDNVQF